MGEVKHTPGPWIEDEAGIVADGWGLVAIVCAPEEVQHFEHDDIPVHVVVTLQANASLIAAAPDHASIAAALCSGAARWDRGEFCVGGLRHSTKLDEFGVPIMTNGMRAALSKASDTREVGA